jgi:hypothetical protein
MANGQSWTHDIFAKVVSTNDTLSRLTKGRGPGLFGLIFEQASDDHPGL